MFAFRVGLAASMKLFWKQQRRVSQGTPSPVRLTMKVSHRRLARRIR